ncbi:MAG: efflux RND transporter periplasmic adaptor subunit [gamma proteobacterium symbiont of Bathyaustriella thionipta]|nr:efflux RND transporter periplasmic adaptor subunit [gamma proteobacterium symbiont of Bathyaustriella thionipta]MCU7950481.1 efflux RND transporter periplasmic adaptor subunit [gamma proteobacterium symbiont of Bathyaustriella thionipta]MCU7954847.1 efflux RND transporter periplasmic adaptor subunit [gamma proteobacterium symbiont of Bathyaustriella thionipta]MCU7956976.1 efflux RND transporter periplasmic adaptor subunit [gamma proteobacterium symbiont of Bathyaustriella thionipta]MCU796797
MEGVVRLGGSVVPKKIVNLTAQMPGDVNFVAGSEGDAFKSGAVLVALDKKSLMAKRQQALSQLASAEAGYRNARVQYNQELVNPNSQGNQMLGGAPGMFSTFSDPARSMMGQGDQRVERNSNLYARGVGIETANNSVMQAKAAIRELDEALQNTISYAPFDGVILKKMVEKGDIVQPGMPLINFANITSLQIRVDVPTRLLKVIKTGSKAQAQLDGEANPVPVVVDRIFPMADAGGHTTTVKFALPSGIKAHSGMYAEIILPDPGSRHSALPTIPESAIVWRCSLPAVFQMRENGTLRLRLIRVDEMPANGMVNVISGIKAGDKILAEPGPNTRASR